MRLGILELRNRVTKLSSSTRHRNLSCPLKKFYSNSSFELLTGLCKMFNQTSSYQLEVLILFFHFLVTNSRLKNKKSNFVLLTQNWKIKKFHFELLIRRLAFYFFTLELQNRSWKIRSYTLGYQFKIIK